MMSIRNWIAFILILLSLLCLYPGLFQPIMSIDITPKLPLVGEVTLYESIQSIVKTVDTLYENDNKLVAFLILLFSIIVPIIKAVVLLLILFVRKLSSRKALYNFVHMIGKWSMADVFVVGVFLAFLATKSNDGFHAELHNGFYYFLAYCLISLVAIQIMEVKEEG
ncbi:MAG: paraquat-inducible protein A [Polaribacter sp.]|jgi:paraquat-inducible protein A